MEEFKNHTLLQEEDAKVYRYAAPDTGIFGFWVMIAPRTIIVWGDLGEWVFRHSYKNSLGWLRGGLGDPYYLAGKLELCRGEIYADEGGLSPKVLFVIDALKAFVAALEEA